MTIKRIIIDYLAARPDEMAFLRTEFAGIGSRSGVDYAICKLIAEGVLIRGGWGVLVRARFNDTFNVFSPAVSAGVFAEEVLRKLGVEWQFDYTEINAYRAHKSTQIVVRQPYYVGKSRFGRKIGYNKVLITVLRGYPSEPELIDWQPYPEWDENGDPWGND
ncbi:MAG: hypothetical protein PF483_07945 [Halothiobacillus sp.]|jgi:hypothetical protein|nr:hypothetical protein [Halothiobacillus sp.]